MGEEELWQSKSADLEKIEGRVWNAGNQEIRIIKATNEELEKTGDLEKRGENRFKGMRCSVGNPCQQAFPTGLLGGNYETNKHSEILQGIRDDK